MDFRLKNFTKNVIIKEKQFQLLNQNVIKYLGVTLT